MKQFVEELENELIDKLNTLLMDNNKLSSTYKAVESVKNALYALRTYLKDHPFADKAAEIYYFKELAPGLYAQLFYYSKKYLVELEKQYASQDKIESLLEHELESIEKFYEQHQDFYRYYYQRSVGTFDHIFVRDRAENMMLDEVEIIMDNDFCVGCYWAARLLANGILRTYLTRELELLRNPPPLPAAPAKSTLVWTDSHTDLVELINGLYLTGSFNQGKAEIKEIAAWFQEHLNVDLGNFYVT